MSRINTERIVQAYDRVASTDLSYLNGVFHGYLSGEQFNLDRGLGIVSDGYGQFDPGSDSMRDLDIFPLVTNTARRPEDLEAKKYKRMVQPDMWIVGDFLSDRLTDKNDGELSPAEIGLYGLATVLAYADQRGVKVGSYLSDGTSLAIKSPKQLAKDALVAMLRSADQILDYDGPRDINPSASLGHMFKDLSQTVEGAIVVPVSDFRAGVNVSRTSEGIALIDGTGDWKNELGILSQRNALLPVEISSGDAEEIPIGQSTNAKLVVLKDGSRLLQPDQIATQRDIYETLAREVADGIDDAFRSTGTLSFSVRTDTHDPIRDVALGLERAARGQQA